ncbi:hypothetical protein AgCh_001943 [Apium graveolens]
MAYLARKFSNIRVKKPRFSKSKGQSFNKDSSWKGKGKYTPDKCRKPKKAKKDKAYLELEAKYDALLKKQQGKAYIAEGNSWDDSDNDEDEEVRNYAFMALEQGDSSSSKSQVLTLTTIDLNVSQYKETVEKMSTEMFHIHTSMVAANEEVSRMKKINEKLESEKQEVELLLVELDAAKQEIAYLKNKLKCASEIEAVLRERLEKNEVKLKSFKNASELIGQYHEKNKPCANIAIGLDYEGLNNNKKSVSNKVKSTEAEDVPIILKKVESPLFKACEVSFSEEELIIKQEIADEDKEKENDETTQSSISVETPKANQETKEPVKEIKAEQGKGKKVIWNIDSGCSRHMTGDKALLSQFEEMAGPLVTFGDNNKGFTMGYGKIVTGNVVIEDVALVAGLEVNLLSISQFADIDLDSTNKEGVCCFYTKASEEQSKLWHKKLSHLNFKAINTQVKKELVRDMPNLEFAQLEVCEACQKGKMKRTSHKSKYVNSISAPMQLIHMDLFGPVNVLSISRNKYALVMVDDFSRYTWVEFMYSKDETPNIIIEHIKKIEKQAEGKVSVKRLRSDNGTKFRNSTLSEFCKSKGIVQEFSAARTPQQDGVVERKNRTLIEAARTLLQDAQLPTNFWEEAVNTACYTQNRYLINKAHGKSPYSIMSN